MVKIFKGVPYTGTLPATLTGTKAGYLHRYKVYGNLFQNGTPTPENPIYPSECGERTGNLFSSSFSANYNINTSGEVVPYTLNSSRCATLTPIDVSNLTTVTFSFTNTSSNDNKRFIYALFDGSTLVSREGYKESGSSINVSQGNKLYLCIYSSDTSIDSSQTITNTMLTEGATALPYEPYGYKLPLTSGNTPVDIYIGESQTTRRIKKLVLDGTERDWEKSSTRAGCFALRGIGTGVTEKTMYCTHATYVSTASQLASNNTCYMGNDFNIWLDLFNAQTTIEQFKDYLAQQLTNGTPVTVWYVLATPTTGTINEPLRKIGDYADTIDSTQTTAQIPTSAGSTTISWAGQGLAPSRFDSIAEWVSATPKIYTNGAWTDAQTYVYDDGAWVADNYG